MHGCGLLLFLLVCLHLFVRPLDLGHRFILVFLILFLLIPWILDLGAYLDLAILDLGSYLDKPKACTNSTTGFYWKFFLNI